MAKKSAAELAINALNRTDLSIEDRSRLTSCILDRLAALPLRDIIKIEHGLLSVHGKVIDDPAAAKSLRESAKAALNNRALNLIYDQVKYIAISTGFLKADSEKQSYFGKAAIWWGEQEANLLKLLAQEESEL